MIRAVWQLGREKFFWTLLRIGQENGNCDRTVTSEVLASPSYFCTNDVSFQPVIACLGTVLMAAAKKKTDDDPEAWEAMLLQVIFFPTTSPRGVSQEWFREITGEQAAQISTKPHEIIAIGSCGNVQITLTIDPVRVAIAIQPQPSPEDDPALPALTGTLKESTEQLFDLARKWLDIARLPIKRIGFAGKLIRRTKDQQSGYRILRHYLPTVNIGPGASDLLYRINRPRQSTSGVSGLTINRLASWMFAKFVRLSQTISASDSHQTAPQKVEEACACVLEFDINTHPGFEREIRKTELKLLLPELAVLALEIPEKGDKR